jgi:hypothetical protein
MGSPEHLTIKEYHERTGIGIGSCISMLSGQCASSGNHIEKFKNGDIALGDPTHAGVVADIVLHMKKCGISFASTNLLIQAISKTVMVDGFDISIFKHKIGTFPSMITKKQNQAQYLMMIEEIYNYKSNKTRLPVAFLAEASAKARKESFGRISALNKRKLKKSKPPKQRSLIGQ